MSSTSVVELEEVHSIPQPTHLKEPLDSISRRQRPSHNIGERALSLNSFNEAQSNDVDGSLPSPITATEQLERWNYPRVNLWRTLAAFWGFIIMGMNDAAVGVSDYWIPQEIIGY
jgi:hypothetical protein